MKKQDREDPWTKLLEEHFQAAPPEPPPHAKDARDLGIIWGIHKDNAKRRADSLVEQGVLTPHRARVAGRIVTFYTPAK